MGHLHRTVLIFLVNLGCLLCTAIFPGLPTGCVWSHRFGHRSEQTVMRVKVTGSKGHAQHTSGSQCFGPSPTCRDLVPKLRWNQVLVLRLVLGLNKSKLIAKTMSKMRPKQHSFLLWTALLASCFLSAIFWILLCHSDQFLPSCFNLMTSTMFKSSLCEWTGWLLRSTRAHNL